MKSLLIKTLKEAEHLVAFTGAGVSTLSGIRDFRGKNGLYNDPNTEKVFDIAEFRQDPSFFYNSTKDFLYNDKNIKPSLVHNVLAMMEKQGLLKSIITQNIDFLHQRAGSRKVFEVHGSPLVHSCISCGRTSRYEDIQARINAQEIPPLCKVCGGPIKPHITFFGENLPEAAFHGAMEEAYRADVMLVLGTSLLVYPAASIPEITAKRGGKLIIVNDMLTPLDQDAYLNFDSLEEVFTELNDHFPS